MFCVASSHNCAGDVPSSEPPILSELRKAIAANDWKGAVPLLTAEKVAQARHFQWNYFYGYVHDAAKRPDDHERQKHARAKAAEMLGLFDLALENYSLQIKLCSSDQDRYYAKTDRAMCAWRATKEAVAASDLKRAATLLNLMQDCPDGWIKDAGKAKRELVRQISLSPNDVDRRIEFAEKFWVDNVPAMGPDYKRARKMLLDSLQLDSTAGQKMRLYKAIQSYSQQMDDAATATQFAHRIAEDDVSSSSEKQAARFQLAQLLFKGRQYEEARKELHQLTKSDGTTKARAHLLLAGIHEQLGAVDGMLAELEQAARAPAAPTNRNIMDTSDTAQTALIRLAQHYQAKREYEKALDYFSRWKVSSWCGTCATQLEYQRDLYIAECLVGLGRPDEALRKHLMPYIDKRHVYYDDRIPALIVAIAERENTLEKLHRDMRGRSKSKEAKEAAEITRDLAQIAIWRKSGDIESLISQLRHEGSISLRFQSLKPDWRVVAATRALADAKGKEFPMLRARYEGLLEKSRGEVTLKDPEREDLRVDKLRRDRVWLLYAIALSSHPAAGEYLQNLLDRAKRTHDRFAEDDLQYALVLHQRAKKP